MIKRTPSKATEAAGAGPRLLSGGNPQIPKGYGDAPVQAYIAAMPGWKRALGERLDAIIARTVPGVAKAVKWNSPFYGVEGEGWFLSFHCFTRYVKVTFFRGTSLDPVPPGASKHPEVRYLDIHEGAFDETQFADWVKQAAALPGAVSMKTEKDEGTIPSRLIDARLRELGDWRGEALARVRELIREADPEAVEAWKWRGVPVWEHDGIICTGETYRKAVKLTFARGAALEDPAGLFNASLDGNTRRAIDIHEGDAIDAEALKALVRAAVALNLAGKCRQG